MSNRKSVGYSKKYAQAMRSFDRSVTRTTNAVSRAAFGQTKRGRTRQDLSAASGNLERTSLTNKQLIASCCGGNSSDYVSGWKGCGNRNNRNASAGFIFLLCNTVSCNGFDLYGIQRNYAPENGMHYKSELRDRRKHKRSE